MKHLVDLSQWQRGVRYAELARAVSGAYVKATDAKRDAAGAWVPFIDPMHEQHSIGLRSAGCPTGSYCFGHPSQDHAASADFFVARAWFDQLRPVLDLESLNADNTIPGNAGAWALAWVGRVRANTGVSPIIYSSKNYAEEMLRQAPELAAEEWWIAAYPGITTPPETMPRVVGLEPRRVLAWQWTGSGRLPGVAGDVDRDVAPEIEPLMVQAADVA